MGHLWTPRLDPTRVPTVPVEIDWGHPLAQGLVGCWLLNGDFRDLSQLGNNGTPIGSPALAGTARGPAMLFNGSNQSISTSLKSVFAGQSLFTISARAMQTSTSANYALLSTDDTSRGMYLSTNIDVNNNPAPGYVQFYLLQSGVGTLGVATTSSVFPANVPATLCAQRNSAASSSLFVNGAPAPTTVYGSYPASLPGTSGMYIGQRPYSGYQDWWSGWISGVTGWNYPLPPALVLQNHLEPFAMLRPIMRRTWFVPASAGPTTIVLGSRAWDWDGAAPNVALAAALAAKQWDWHGDAAALSKEIAPAPAQWDWRGAAPEQSRIVLPTPKAWAWRPSAPALSFPLRLVAAGWRWSGQGAVILGALTLLLARAVWRWSAHGVPLAGRGAGWLSGVIGGTIRGLLAKDKP